MPMEVIPVGTPAAETETTRGTGSGIQCEVVNTTPEYEACENDAAFWLEIFSLDKLMGICAHHAAEWEKFAPTQPHIKRNDWAIYPMR